MELEYYRKYEPIFGEWYIKEELGSSISGKVAVITRDVLGITYSSALRMITVPNSYIEISKSRLGGKSLSEYYEDIVRDIQKQIENIYEFKGHSNIVTYENYKLIQHDDGVGWDILIQMELLTPLYKHVSHNDLTSEDVVKLGIDICNALDAYHRKGIIHSDVSLNNIFYSDNGCFKLGDSITVDPENTAIGVKMFAAPEIYNQGNYNVSSDIYSLGIVMYTLLNKYMLPFENTISGNPTLVHALANKKRMTGEKLDAPMNASRRLAEIILKACEYNPEDRYSSAEEMKKDLEGLNCNCEKNIFDDADSQEDRLSDKSKEKSENKDNASRGKISKKVLLIIAALIVAAVGGLAIFSYANIRDIAGINEDETILYGEQLEPEYAVEPDRFADSKLTFDIEDDSIVEVDKDGKLTALDIGTTVLTITATSDNGKTFAKEVEITVNPKVTSIENIEDSYTITVGKKKSLSPKLSPEDYEDEKVSYSIEDKTIATVNSKGVITAKKSGSTKLVISSGGCEKTIAINVKKSKKSKSVPEITGIKSTSCLSEYDMTHYAKRIHDGKLDRAWVEGASGQGIGESVTFKFDKSCVIKSLSINAGYQKTEELYYKNSRPHKLKIIYSSGESETINLDDVYDVQYFNLKYGKATSKITIEILSVYEGDTFEDTVISEIDFDYN